LAETTSSKPKVAVLDGGKFRENRFSSVRPPIFGATRFSIIFVSRKIKCNCSKWSSTAQAQEMEERNKRKIFLVVLFAGENGKLQSSK